MLLAVDLPFLYMRTNEVWVLDVVLRFHGGVLVGPVYRQAQPAHRLVETDDRFMGQLLTEPSELLSGTWFLVMWFSLLPPSPQWEVRGSPSPEGT